METFRDQHDMKNGKRRATLTSGKRTWRVTFRGHECDLCTPGTPKVIDKLVGFVSSGSAFRYLGTVDGIAT